MKTREQLLKDFIKQTIKSCISIKDGHIEQSEAAIDKRIKDYVEAENKSLFKFPYWINEDRLGKDPMVWVITEEMIQEEAEQEIKRRLSDLELHRVFHAQYEDDETSWSRMVLIREVILNVINNPEPWSYYDECFLEDQREALKKK
jgi:hypothetical protein